MNNIMGLLVGVPIIALLWIVVIGVGFFFIQLVRGRI
jgi:hypothetical protein